jgi:hypothetical protein
MKIEKLTEIIMSTRPCGKGLRWYKDLSEGCKTSTEFFINVKNKIINLTVIVIHHMDI